MAMSPALQRLLDQLPPGRELEFERLIAAVRSVRFTGPLTIDFLNGDPKQISLGQPVKLAICSAAANGRVDKPPSSGSS